MLDLATNHDADYGMSPFYEGGRKYIRENEFDDALIPFWLAFGPFDSALENRKRILRLRASEVYIKAFRELGQPFALEKYWPVSYGPITVISPYETDRLFEELKIAYRDKNRRAWNRLKKKFVYHVTAEFRSNTDFICVTVHGQMIRNLIEIVRDSKDYESRKEALLKLVELDMALLTLLPTSDVIVQAELSQDLKFKAALSRALDPAHRTNAFQKQRQRHALFMLSCCGYKSKSYSKWSGFFKHFNAQLGEQSGIPRESAFTSFEQPDTVRFAIKDHGVPKDRERAGRRKKQANKS